MPTGVVVRLVLVEDGVQVQLVLVRPLHQLGDDAGRLRRGVDVVDEVAHTVDDDKAEVFRAPDGYIDDGEAFLRRVLPEGKELQTAAVLVFGQTCQAKDALHHLLAVVSALFRIDIEDVVLVFRE